ncbi:hypothetical protein ACIQ9Q_41920 [Streptomyces sp. NPDC094438]|uniref:hypothetical protein n=1 Tax=Streptomyces sp. NPDC094438 TaxID=3366061 RepID=UPI0038090340
MDSDRRAQNIPAILTEAAAEAIAADISTSPLHGGDQLFSADAELDVASVLPPRNHHPETPAHSPGIPASPGRRAVPGLADSS